MAIIGADISHHQNAPDLKATITRAQFVLCKATEGTAFVDNEFSSNIGTLRALDHPRGAYHFASGTSSPAAEAAHFLKVAKPQRGEVSALDVEAEILTRQPGDRLVSWCREWLDIVAKATGSTPIIYMSLSVTRTRNWRDLAKLYPLWQAQYGATMAAPSYWGNPLIWQYSSKSTMPGIAGYVDVNRWVGPVSTFNEMFGVKQPVKPAPVTDDLGDIMAPVTFTDANKMSDLMEKGVAKAEARKQATVTYSDSTAALVGVLSFVSSILRDMGTLKAELAALKKA